MRLAYAPLLRVQRELYAIPRGRERFNEYLRTMIDPNTKDIRLPLGAMNPMGKDDIPGLLDAYLKLDADAAAAKALAKVRVEDVPGDFRVSLVMADDAKGGWTNRHAAEFSHRFESKALLKRGWLVGLLWTSETPSARTAIEAALAAVFRAAHLQKHGPPKTLREMLAQEGYAMARAGCAAPALEPDDLAYTAQVLAPHLEAKVRPVIMACLFGDKAARDLGYAPQGLSPFAGLALALHQASSA